jgi:prepilin signal peptidase PulO-like enzyme (type II secretory pathway)
MRPCTAHAPWLARDVPLPATPPGRCLESPFEHGIGVNAAIGMALFAGAALLAGLANLAIDRLRLQPRRYSPWNDVLDRLLGRHVPRVRGTPLSRRPDAGRRAGRRKHSGRRAERIAPRGWLDLLPIVGWLRLRREEPLHGRGFWIRPLLIELCTGLLAVALYLWEVVQQRIVPAELLGAASADQWADVLTQVYAAHMALLLMMTAATWIDIDELYIPDGITVPGTLLGLLLAALMPEALLPVATLAAADQAPQLDTLVLNAPRLPGDWPAVLQAGKLSALAIALACLWLWCFALLPRVWRLGRGFRIAAALFWRRLRREAFTYQVLAVGLAASGGAVAAWLVGGAVWEGLLTALVGMAVGAVVVWTVRLAGALVLRREAMGFGDVTLMAMIGAFLGWQAVLIAFFLSPFFALVPGVLMWISRGRLHLEIPFGPFLCCGALATIFFWRPLWRQVEPVFEYAGLVPAVLAACVPLLLALLLLLRGVKRLLGVAD